MAINTIYLDNAILKRANGIFNSQNPKNIRIVNLFQKSVFLLIQKKLLAADFKIKFTAFKYMYHAAKLKEIDSFIKGEYFRHLVRGITGIGKFKIKYEIRKFGAGDYTILHDEAAATHAIDFIIDFSEEKSSNGGHTVYLSRDEELLHVAPEPNTLAFIEKRRSIMKYTKYVNHNQKKPILQVAGMVQKR